MKTTLKLLPLFIFIFSATTILAQQVVVIPLSSSKKIHHIVTVAKKGGDFTDPVVAVESIVDAGANNRYLVFIGPGIYPLLKTLTMKPYVSVAGSGVYDTYLTGTVSSGTADATSALVSAATDTTLRDLFIENNGGGVHSIGLYVGGFIAPIITNIQSSARYGENTYGVYCDGASPHLENISASGFGGTNSYGIYINGGSPFLTGIRASGVWGSAESAGLYTGNTFEITLDGVVAEALGEINAYGINNQSEIILSNGTATASMGTTNYGIYNAGSLTMGNVKAEGEDAPWVVNSYGVYNNVGVSSLRGSILTGGTHGLYQEGAGSTASVFQSSILNTYGESTLSPPDGKTCLNSDNGVDKLLDANCTVIP